MTKFVGTKFQLKQTILIFLDEFCSKREFPVENWKIALVRASMVVTYYIKFFSAGTDRHNGILISLLLLVAQTIFYLKAGFECVTKNWKITMKGSISVQR